MWPDTPQRCATPSRPPSASPAAADGNGAAPAAPRSSGSRRAAGRPGPRGCGQRGGGPAPRRPAPPRCRIPSPRCRPAPEPGLSVPSGSQRFPAAPRGSQRLPAAPPAVAAPCLGGAAARDIGPAAPLPSRSPAGRRRHLPGYLTGREGRAADWQPGGPISPRLAIVRRERWAAQGRAVIGSRISQSLRAGPSEGCGWRRAGRLRRSARSTGRGGGRGFSGIEGSLRQSAGRRSPAEPAQGGGSPSERCPLQEGLRGGGRGPCYSGARARRTHEAPPRSRL